MDFFSSFDVTTDPRMTSFFGLDTMLVPTFWIMFYLSFIYWGPKLMENRKPFKLTKIITAYNLIQIAVNAFLLAQFWSYMFEYNILCTPPISREHKLFEKLTFFVYIYFLVKMFDFVETIMFILRKKNSQVTFLHVFHHVGIVVVTWATARVIPAGHMSLAAYMNSIVHVLMYSYYLASSYIDFRGSVIKKSLTFIQIAHQILAALSILIGFLNPYCDHPKYLSALVCSYVIVVIYLFVDFYKQSYKKKPKVDKVKVK